MCMSVYVCVHHVHVVSRGPEKGVKSPGAGVTCLKTSIWVLGTQLKPLQGQQVL